MRICSVCKQQVEGSGAIQPHMPWCPDKDNHAAGNHPIVLDPITQKPKQLAPSVPEPVPIPEPVKTVCANCQGQDSKHYEWCPQYQRPPEQDLVPPALEKRFASHDLPPTEPPSAFPGDGMTQERIASALESIALTLKNLLDAVQSEAETEKAGKTV